MNVNDKLHRLTLIRDAGVIKKKKHGVFHCDCGNEVTTVISAVKIGRTKSCGCLQLEMLYRAHEAQRGEYGESSCRAVYNMYRCSARKRKIPFELTYEHFKQLTKLNCTYCGGSPSTVKTNPHYYGEYIYNGIDRIDNAKSYEVDNVVPCCKTCNYMKLDRSKEEFVAHVKKICEHLDTIEK